MSAARTDVLFAALAGAALAACGGPSGPAPEWLVYGQPDPNPATYTFADTAVFAVDSDLGPMEVVTARAGTAELDFRGWPDDGRVVVRFPELSGSFRNPAQTPRAVDESDIGGAVTVRLTPAGRVEVVDTPALSDAILEIVGPTELVRHFFVHLPGRPLDGGRRWVDTVTTVERRGGVRSVTRRVITSTLRGDTVTAGRRLIRIGTESASTVALTGVSGGVEVRQEVTGTILGTVLWDPAARVLVDRWAEGELTGTLELPGLDAAPMPVRLAVRRVATLRQR